MRFFPLLALALACAPEGRTVKGRAEVPPDSGAADSEAADSAPPADDGGGAGSGDDTGDAVAYDGPAGFIGSACETDADCPYDGGSCLTDADGYPRGTCSMDCASTCPDATGYPTTSCIDEGALPAGVPDDPGACLSRCDFGIYPYDGCRPGYGCVQVARADTTLLDVYACLPGRDMDIGPCRTALAARGLPFEPQIREDSHPEGDDSLTCHVEEPVKVGPTVAGVDLRYYYDDEPDRVLVDCETAGAIADTVEDVGPFGVVELVHVGTYNCRLIDGSSSLSQHGLGRALDVNGFTFEDGSTVTVYDHWEDGDTSPDTAEGQFLYDAVHRWYDDWIWNIILTPEYNDAHDNHFHVDLTEGSHTLRSRFGGDRYLGPPPDGHMD